MKSNEELLTMSDSNEIDRLNQWELRQFVKIRILFHVSIPQSAWSRLSDFSLRYIYKAVT